MNYINRLTLLVLLVNLPFLAIAKEECDNIDSFTGFDNFEFSLKDDKKARLKDYCKIYHGIKAKDPEHLNIALSELSERSNGLAFLKDVDFKFKSFEETGTASGLGFSYDYTKTNKLGGYEFVLKDNLTKGTAWGFSAKGNVAFDSDINPSDFTDIRFSVKGFRDYGGVTSADEVKSKLNILDDLAVDLEGEALVANRVQAKQIMSQFFTTQVYLGYDFNLGLESNQNFTSKQWTYGVKLVLDAKGYGKDNELGKWNLLDYPFALLRIATGFQGVSSLKPLGYSFPTFLIGLDQVDPSDNDMRKAIGEDDKYGRVKAEIHFRTPIWGNSDSLVFANLDWRYWQEIDPSDVIIANNLDNYDYQTFSISARNGIYVSYSDGRLPFDQQDRQVYELGWKTHLE